MSEIVNNASSMNTINPTLVIALYNRKEPSLRLLNSLAKAHYPDTPVNMVISIDNDNNKNMDIKELAENFLWEYGTKEVIFHEKNIGLRDHFNFCGDFTYKYGTVIFLEDDLFVSPYFYDYTLQALDFYKDDNNIAGISLFNYNRIEHKVNPWPFTAIDDGYDNYFLQQASWGQIWTYDMWKSYKDWYVKYGNPEYINSLEEVPLVVRKWRASSWKKNYISHMILHGKYYVFPRIALATNFDDVGTHRRSNTVHYQSPLLLHEKKFNFSKFENSLSIYDSYFEILPHIVKKFNPELQPYDFQVNLYGDKEPEAIKSKYVLSKIPGKTNVKCFNLVMKPHELNVLFNIEGDKLFLCEVKDLLKEDHKIRFVENIIYHYRGIFKLDEIGYFLKYKMKNRLGQL
jgi:hypothetical protein